jgi:2-oxoglutarate dehydrogenase E1 component
LGYIGVIGGLKDMGDDVFKDQISNLDYLESLYHLFQASPSQLTPDWQNYFRQLGQQRVVPPPARADAPCHRERIKQLIASYHRYGHFQANVNPLETNDKQKPFRLRLDTLGFSENDLQQKFPTLGILSHDEAPLSHIIQRLEELYCNGIGFDYQGENPVLDEWLKEKIVGGTLHRSFSAEEKKTIFDLLNQAEFFETFLHTKHVGKKRFSLEGAETVIPMLASLVEQGAAEGVKEFVIGMSHRGRLNVIANVLHKPMIEILRDFDESCEPDACEGMGDIRYHKGHVNDWVVSVHGHNIKLTLPPNPSHLESIDPVVEGQTRAKQVLLKDEEVKKKTIPILTHGEAAIAGQGVVYETLQLSRLPGYETGGTLHLVINNQVGFTANPEETRSTPYCTDIAHAFDSPVFHLNSEKVEHCIRTILLAFEIRQKFHCDVFLDLYCYRKHGHNEGDEPAFTQPKEYQAIRKKLSLRELYREQLIQEGVLTTAAAQEMEELVKKQLQDVFNQYQLANRGVNEEIAQTESDANEIYDPFYPIDTRIDRAVLGEIADRLIDIPHNHSLHPKVDSLIKERWRAIQEDKPLDWGTAETLAFASLLWEGVAVRLSGQDSGRGTFSHRHALLVCQETGAVYSPLAHLREEQGRFEVLNSCLSEEGVLAFEYGYSTAYEQCLTIWEAQFGDFANSAQVIIDNYIASGEEKWDQKSGIVLFLPHGFEGQGPEHSSGRIERFLSLAGHDNIIVTNPTTPAQLFHLLRRQALSKWKKPLVVFTPKGLLRHPSCQSTVRDLTEGKFLTLIGDDAVANEAQKIVFCTGRIYYECDAKRRQERRNDVALIRIEQLYPLDEKRLLQEISRYQQLKECCWVQEEPENMGAWSYIAPYLRKLLPTTIALRCVSRERSATPATGYYARHKKEQADLLDQGFHT